MEKKKAMITPDQSSLEKMDVGRRPQSIFSRTPSQPLSDHPSPPDPEVPPKAIRRKYPGEYKLKILKEAETCTLPGELGALLRREGLYSSHLTTWRQEQGILDALATLYRILKSQNEVRERRDQLRHPNYRKPELLATAPNQFWSWDITKLKGPAKWTYFYLYVILDIFSRYVVGWMVAHQERAALAKKLISQSCE